MENGWTRGIIADAFVDQGFWRAFVLPEGADETIFTCSRFYLDESVAQNGLFPRAGMSVVFGMMQDDVANPVRLAKDGEYPTYSFSEDEEKRGFSLCRGVVCFRDGQRRRGYVTSDASGPDTFIHIDTYRVRMDLGGGQVRWLFPQRVPWISHRMEVVFLRYTTKKGHRAAVWSKA